MKKREIKEMLVTVLSQYTDVKPTPKTLLEDLGMDSLDIMEAEMDMEREFDINFSEDEWDKLKSQETILDFSELFVEFYNKYHNGKK